MGEAGDDLGIDDRGVSREELPNTNAAVSTDGGDLVSGGVEGDRVDLFQWLDERVEPLAGCDQPHLAGVVGAGADEVLAIRAKGDVVHGPGVAFEGANLFAGLGVPEDDLLVITTCREQFAIRGEFGVVEDIAVGTDLTHGLAGGEIPEDGLAIQTRYAGGSQESIPRDEVQGGDLARQSLQRQRGLRIIRCSQFHPAKPSGGQGLPVE